MYYLSLLLYIHSLNFPPIPNHLLFVPYYCIASVALGQTRRCIMSLILAIICSCYHILENTQCLAYYFSRRDFPSMFKPRLEQLIFNMYVSAENTVYTLSNLSSSNALVFVLSQIAGQHGHVRAVAQTALLDQEINMTGQ